MADESIERERHMPLSPTLIPNPERQIGEDKTNPNVTRAWSLTAW